ncbi:MMPL family transporter [Demequina sp. TTPB684]|uniref:MMPL family transporter n=1 Tax=unclassified Demequina TaxID=2620311 RepID=UPI001CF58C44|nr:MULTISPECIES: MMPL family transporter [unclassified Demequina]MCB2412056.1 MMPL family transporter [Demequina sp. TTPB684]UPU88019.1 MMPL family transporter [Demequina sp. TMPB413]
MNVSLTGRLARTAATRPWLTVAGWILAMVAAGAAAGSIDSYVTPAQINLVTTEADRADELDQQHRVGDGDADRFAEQLIVTSHTATAGSADFDAVLADAVAAMNDIDGVADVSVADAVVAPTDRSAIVDFTVEADLETLREVVDAADAAGTETVDAFVSGPESTQLALNDLANKDLARGEGIGIAVALVVLVFVFGAVVAAGLPLLVALGSMVIALGLGAIASRVLASSGTEVSDSLTIFVGMMGLALGIDYSLLTVQRFREELAKGHSVLDAVTITGSTANRAVLTSGLTVVASIGGLMLLPQNTFLGIGIAIIAVALSAVSIALFLLPAVLRLLGHRVNAWRLPMRHPGETSKGWTRLATWVARRPGSAAAAGLVTLGIVAAPVLSLQFAMPTPDSWPDDFVLNKANVVYTEDFGFTDAATTVAITGASDAQIASLAADIEADPGFAGTTVDARDGATFIDTHDTFDVANPASGEAIERLRDQLIPLHLDGTEAEAFVGGARAAEYDNYGLIASRAPWAVAFILGITFVLLLVMFRSVVVPLKAILMNLIGTTATFGALVATYQWGWGDALGLPTVDGISPYMPVMVFALVFGLSMDYHVFLLSRIRERYDATGDTRTAVIEGVSKTGPLITGAALIMIGVFGGFASASIPELSQWGFGLAVGVLLDATIIRILLVPAAMTWLDKANWYLPSWLEWLPRVQHHEHPAPALEEPHGEREPALV